MTRIISTGLNLRYGQWTPEGNTYVTLEAPTAYRVLCHGSGLHKVIYTPPAVAIRSPVPVYSTLLNKKKSYF